MCPVAKVQLCAEDAVANACAECRKTEWYHDQLEWYQDRVELAERACVDAWLP